jgi:hypothetical protein
VVAQGTQHRARSGEQAVLAGGRRQLGQPRAEDETTLHVARHEAVVLERHRQPVGGRSGQPGRPDELGESGRARFQRRQDSGSLVQNADPA